MQKKGRAPCLEVEPQGLDSGQGLGMRGRGPLSIDSRASLLRDEFGMG